MLWSRVLIMGAVLVAAVLVVAALERDDAHQATAATAGDVGSCAKLTGDAARGCYRRVVGEQLAAVGSAPQAVFTAQTGTVTFAADEQSAGLLCELHLRAGVTDERRPAWLSWSEPPVS